jgi:hypothetical protein
LFEKAYYIFERKKVIIPTLISISLKQSFKYLAQWNKGIRPTTGVIPVFHRMKL